MFLKSSPFRKIVSSLALGLSLTGVSTAGPAASGVTKASCCDSAGSFVPSSGESASTRLEAGQAVEREISGGECHVFSLTVAAGHLVGIAAAERRVDLVLTVFDPTGREIRRVTTPDCKFCIEELSLVGSSKPRTYELQVQSGDQVEEMGWYRLAVESRPSRPGDEERLTAEKLIDRGDRDRSARTQLAIESARKRYAKAFSLYRKVRGFSGERRALRRLGDVQGELSLFPEALASYQQAMAVPGLHDRPCEEARILSDIAYALLRTRETERALRAYDQAIEVLVPCGDQQGEAAALDGRAQIHIHMAEYDKALENLNRAFRLSQLVVDRRMEGWILANTASLHLARGDHPGARKYLELAVARQRELHDYGEQAYSLASLSEIENYFGNRQRAMEHLTEALALYRLAGHSLGEGQAYYRMGVIQSDIGNYEEAVRHYGAGLPKLRKAGDATWEGAALLGLGVASYYAAAYDAALNYYTQALRLAERTKAGHLAAGMLQKMGNLHESLGELDKAAKSYEEARDFWKRIGVGQAWARCMTSIGRIHQANGALSEAIDHYSQALEAQRRLDDRFGQAETLTELGTVQGRLGRYAEARAHLQDALAVLRAVRSVRLEAEALVRLGNVEMLAGNSGTAIRHLNEGLGLTREVGLKEGEAFALALLMELNAGAGNRALAIFFGKQAVNRYQEARDAIRGMEKETQRRFLHSREDTYRKLAELLIDESRLEEAQQVLDLLKEEEYFDFVLRDRRAVNRLDGRAAMTSAESGLERDYRELGEVQAALGLERGQLLSRKSLNPEQEKRLAELERQLELVQTDFEQFLQKLARDLRRSGLGEGRLREVREAQGLMTDLRELGAGAVALYTLVGSERYSVILITSDVQIARDYPITAAELSRKVAAFRQVLQDPHQDPLPLSQEVYRILIGPIARDLTAAQASTLMWSLDGVLRYVPIAALHDGQQYLVERFRNVVFTPASHARLKDIPSRKWKALGLGVSKAHAGFQPLPDAREELLNIIRDERAPARRGILPGRIMLDEAFSEPTMRAALRQRFPLVHIASHFRFDPTNEARSFLLLGDGKQLTLAQIKRAVNLFDGVELLTLSACNTATGGGGSTGKEVEGFGVLAQRQGAKAVLATLWRVADRSTKTLMQRFYRLRSADPRLPKAEALRQAQLSLLHAPSGRSRTDGSEEALSRHPFFWAPFVLIGNWK